jgi:hypothetical protein
VAGSTSLNNPNLSRHLVHLAYYLYLSRAAKIPACFDVTRPSSGRKENFTNHIKATKNQWF